MFYSFWINIVNTVWGNTCCLHLRTGFSRKRATSQKLCPTKKLIKCIFSGKKGWAIWKKNNLFGQKKVGSSHLCCIFAKIKFYTHTCKLWWFRFWKLLWKEDTLHQEGFPLVWHNSMFAFNAKTSAMTLFKTTSAWLLKIKRGILYVDFFTNFPPIQKIAK